MAMFGRKDNEKQETAADDLLAYWDDEYKDSDKNARKADLFDEEDDTKKRKKFKKKDKEDKKEHSKSKKSKRRDTDDDERKSFRLSKKTAKRIVLFVAFLGVLAGASLAVNKVNEKVEATQEADPNSDYSNMPDKYSFGKGQYKCGEDFKPGFYYIECDESSSLTEVQIKNGSLLKKAENLGSAASKTGFNYNIKYGMIVQCDGYIEMEWLNSGN